LGLLSKTRIIFLQNEPNKAGDFWGFRTDWIKKEQINPIEDGTAMACHSPKNKCCNDGDSVKPFF
jgi:hypothetical protein